MTEPKKVGEFYDDWRDHFKTLESIAEMPDTNVLIVGSNSKQREKFPTDVLGHLPELTALYLRNFDMDFTHFGGHLSRRVSVLTLWEVRVIGNWFAHWNHIAEFNQISFRNCEIESCDEREFAPGVERLEKFWGYTVYDSKVPDDFFEFFARRAVNIDSVSVVSTPGLTLNTLRRILSRKKLTSISLENIGVTREWISELKTCDSLNDISLSNNKELQLHDLLMLAELPYTSLKYLYFDFKKQPKDSLSEFRSKWQEIKLRKFNATDDSAPNF